MTLSWEHQAKRVLSAALGLITLWPFWYLLQGAIQRPSRAAFTTVAVLAASALMWPLLWPRWDRWPKLASGNRLGLLFLSAFLTPTFLLLIAGAQHLEDYVLVMGTLAVSVTALWWALRGHALDAAVG